MHDPFLFSQYHGTGTNYIKCISSTQYRMQVTVV
jgi:hypothetical protein